MLQHRGQDSAGMVTLKSDRKFVEIKANGLVKDVFNNVKTMDKLQGKCLHALPHAAIGQSQTLVTYDLLLLLTHNHMLRCDKSKHYCAAAGTCAV